MANIRYTNEFYSTEGTLWRIDIIDSLFSGSASLFTTTSPNFELIYQGGKDRFDPVMASELTVMAWVQDSAFETFINDIAGAGENRFYAKLYKNNAFEWAGTLISDDIVIEDSYYPYEFRMGFTDGLGTLKDKPFVNESNRPETLYTGKSTFITLLYRLITHSGPGLNGNTLIWSATDTFISTCVHWYDDHHNFYASADPLLYSRVSNEAFYDESDGAIVAKNCYDILCYILDAFGCRLKLSGGSYRILQVNENICTNQIWRKYRVTDGAYLGCVFEANKITSASYDILAGRTYSYFPGLMKAIKKYNYKPSEAGNNLLPKKNNFETLTAFIGKVPGGAGETLQFNGTIVQTYTVVDPIWPNTHCPIFALEIKITSEDGLTVYYLNEITTAEGNKYEWNINISTVKVYGRSEDHPFLGAAAGTYVEGIDLSFITPIVPFDCSGDFKFNLVGYEDDYTHVISTPSEFEALYVGFVFHYYCAKFQIQPIFQTVIQTAGLLIIGVSYRISAYVIGDDFMNCGALSNADGVEFTATDTTPTNWTHGSTIMNLQVPNAQGQVEFIAQNQSSGMTKIYEAKETIIGDGHNKISIGRIETSNGTTWVNSSLWQVKKTGTGKKLHQLFVNEVILGQLSPVMTMILNTTAPTLRAHHSIVLSDSTVWACLNCRLHGNADMWSGTWFKILNMTIAEQAGIYASSGVFINNSWSLQSWVSTLIYEYEKDKPDTNTGSNNISGQTNSGTTKQIEVTISNILNITTLSTQLNSGATVTSLPVAVINYDILNKGDKIYISQNNVSTNFTVSADQFEGATSIAVESTLLTSTLYVGASVIMGMCEFIAKSNGSKNRNLSIISNTTVVIPAGYMATLIAINNLGVEFTLKVGTSAGGSEIFEDVISVGELRSLPLNLPLSASTNQNIYVSSLDWSGASIKFYIKKEKLFYI